MAEGYARVSGKPGVVLVTSGPGATNVVTPMQDALSDGTPLVVFCGQVPTTAIGSDACKSFSSACAYWLYAVKSILILSPPSPRGRRSGNQQGLHQMEHHGKDSR